MSASGPPTVAVVIDVFRAFTTAAVAFDQRASRIVCVKDLDEAVALRNDQPDALLVGEDRGLRPDAFDFGNSPSSLRSIELTGRTLILRTSNGTRGLVDATTDHVMAASAANAAATARYIQATWPNANVRFVATRPGNEDQACAGYIAAHLAGEKWQIPADELAMTLRELADAEIARWGNRLGTDHPELAGYTADVALCCLVDSIPIAMIGERMSNGVHLTPARKP